MEKSIGAYEARRQLGKMINDILARGDRYVVERHGEAVAVLVPVAVYAQWKRAREAFFDQMEEVAARADMGNDEAQSLVSEAIRDARAARQR